MREFLRPLSNEFIESWSNKHPDSLGSKLSKFVEEGELPDWENARVALIGVQEDRRARKNDGAGEGPDYVRGALYDLFFGRWSFDVVDLGNIEPGNRVDDTYFALSAVVHELAKADCIPIIIGGSQDLTFANYKAYEKLEQSVNICSVDAQFDLGVNNQELSNETYLSHIILQKPNILFNFSNIGFQTYYVHQEEIDLMESLHFERHRIGLFHHNIGEAEPILRDADIVSFDMRSIRHSDAPANRHGSPNGWYGEEACAIARYAGMSDKLTSFGIYEYNPQYDRHEQTAKLGAQMIWYFLEGISVRKNDFPFGDRSSYAKYIVPNSTLDQDLHFYKSDRSGRWWIEVPLQGDPSIFHKRHALIPCSYFDYLQAAEDEIPDRWMSAFRKLS
ncbi:MAG: formimidoylglutamase [Flavobacteriales bacterium]|nr:formimidoylglutamase [Flavobacteriales bacterium]